jgi:hypothetical protein
MPIEIEVCERLADSWLDFHGKRQPKYHAQIKDRPGIWGCGKTREAAITDLITSHYDLFNIKVTALGKLAR